MPMSSASCVDSASVPFIGVKPVKISTQNRYSENRLGFVKLAVVYVFSEYLNLKGGKKFLEASIRVSQ